MLILTRKIGEEVVIGGNIRVRVVAIKGQRISIGITAPPCVPVVREELVAPPSGDTGATTGGRNSIRLRRGSHTPWAGSGRVKSFVRALPGRR
jgi:carbon storage regulator CsrA